MIWKLRSSKRPRLGQAMVEMALVVTILVVLSAGVADFGMYMTKYIAVANCTREAARNAAVGSAIPTCAGLTVTYADPLHSAGTTVTASVSTAHNWIAIGYLVPGLGASI